jgi:hypothetical protein
MKKLTKYEKQQVAAIEMWKKEEPGVVSKAFGFAIEPLAWLVNKVVPEAAIRGALDFSNTLAQWLTDTGDIIRDGGVSSLSELRQKNLELSDKLADEVHNWAIGVAVVEGAGTGVFGLPGAAADVPAVITLALRTIHKIGSCYGYECSSELDKKFILGVMSASGANSVSERLAALAALRSIEVTLAKVTWKKMAEKAAENQLGKEAAILTIKSLAKQLGINITKRKALASIPFIGAAIGGSVNGWYIKEVGWAARRAFQERWLIENGKIIDV